MSSLATFGKDVKAFKGTERIFIEACLTKGLDCVSIVVLGFVAFACFFVKSFPLKEPSSILKLMKKKKGKKKREKERLIKIPELNLTCNSNFKKRKELSEDSPVKNWGKLRKFLYLV